MLTGCHHVARAAGVQLTRRIQAREIEIDHRHVAFAVFGNESLDDRSQREALADASTTREKEIAPRESQGDSALLIRIERRDRRWKSRRRWRGLLRQHLRWVQRRPRSRDRKR